MNKNGSKKNRNSKRRHHAHTAEYDDPPRKRVKQESEDEYVLIFALTGTVTHGSKDWLIDNGASKHMTGFKESFEKLSKHNSPHKVKLGDDYQYPIKGSGKSSYKLDWKVYENEGCLVCTRTEEESSFHIGTRCKRHEGCICR